MLLGLLLLHGRNHSAVLGLFPLLLGPRRRPTAAVEHDRLSHAVTLPHPFFNIRCPRVLGAGAGFAEDGQGFDDLDARDLPN